MKTLSPFDPPNGFLPTISLALPVGVATTLLLLSAGIIHNPVIRSIAEALSGWGNDAFLIATNLLIFAWAWRHRLRSLIPLTLWLDFLVWLTVQGAKAALTDASWALRPTGAPGGFPSGHATHSFAMAFLLTFLFPRLGWLWYLCAAAISWSRLEVYAHSDFQIITGIILGISLGWMLTARWLKHPEAAAFISPAAAVTTVFPAKPPYAADKIS